MDVSFDSADDNEFKDKHCLFNEIQEMNTNNWPTDELDFSLGHEEQNNEEKQTQSNCDDLPLESKIENILQSQPAQPIINVTETVETQSKEMVSQGPPSSISSNSSLPSQVTITLHEESICSKIYEQIETIDASNFSSSLKSFLSLNDKNYKPHVKCMKFLFSRLKEFSQKSLENLKNYITFLEVKMKQEIQSLRFLDAIEAVSELQPDSEGLNMDEKVILTKGKELSIQRREQRKIFYSTLQEQYDRLLHCWRKIKERREKRQRLIEEQIIRVIDRIELEMEDMIVCRLQCQREKIEGKFVSEKIRSKNPFLTKDKYLELKYLMQREKAYLKLITQLNGKVITYLVSIFSKEELIIAKNIKEVMLNYATSYMECYDPSNDILSLKIDSLEDCHCDQNMREQLAQLLLTIVPIELYNIEERKKDIRNAASNKLDTILEDFSDCLQNTIFLETIEMNNDFILFRNEAVWKTSSSLLEKEQSGILYESRNDSKFESRQALAQSRRNLGVPDAAPKRNIRVVVVLTSNYFLHLENQDKIATLRLGEIKLSKRGREIVISNKEKGLGGYFGMKKQLGALEFQSTTQVQQFAHKLSRALSKLG